MHNVLPKVATNVCTCSWLPESSIPRQGSMWPQPWTGIGKLTAVPRVTRWAEVCSLRQRLLPLLTRIWDRHRRIRTWHWIRRVENATNGGSHTRPVCHLARVPGLVNDSIIFCLLFCKNSLVCLEIKPMTPYWGDTIFFCSTPQLLVSFSDPRWAVWAEKWTFKGSELCLVRCQRYKDTVRFVTLAVDNSWRQPGLSACENKLFNASPWL